MKLASLKHERDGTLVVVSRDLSHCVPVGGIAPTLQYALDHWDDASTSLALIYQKLNNGELDDAMGFDPHQCASPLPRAYQWADASAYLNHVELVRQARGATVPENFWESPLLYQGGSDSFLAPHDNIAFPEMSEQWGLDFEAEVAIITDDVALGVDQEEAASHIKLIMLVNDVSLRHLIPAELAKGFGFFQSKPSSTFSPVCVTPDELGDAWNNCKVNFPLRSYINGSLYGCPNAGIDMTFNFSRLVSHAAHTRPLCAGTIIGSGTVSNKFNQGPGKTIAEGGVGYSCIAEQRMVEIIQKGEAETEFLKSGDEIKIEMLNDNNQSIFSSIEQRVE